MDGYSQSQIIVDFPQSVMLVPYLKYGRSKRPDVGILKGILGNQNVCAHGIVENVFCSPKGIGDKIYCV